jgi:hypothetical protein
MNSKEARYYAVVNTQSLGFNTPIFDYPMSRSSATIRPNQIVVVDQERGCLEAESVRG